MNHKCSLNISVIIPALNEEKFIGKCLESLTEIEQSPYSFEVIVVDNGSTDRTCDIVRSFTGQLDLQVMVRKGVNISALRNFGASQATGDIYAFLDADCTVTQGWLQNALACFKLYTNVAAVGCSYEVPAGFGWVATIWDSVVLRHRKNGSVKQLPAGNMVVNRKKFEAVNGFDERLQTNEDFDLCYRFIDKGYKIIANEAVKVYHWGTPNSLRDFYKQTRWHGRHVYKVFFSNWKKKRNIKAVLYGLYFFVVQLIWIIFFIYTYFIGFISFIFFLLLGLTVLPPVLLSCKILYPGNIKKNMQLSILYLLYGVARSHSILDVLRSKRIFSTRTK